MDRVGRRTLFLSAGIGMLITFSIWTACSAVYAQTGNASAGSAVLAMIFLFYGGKSGTELSMEIVCSDSKTAAGLAWPGLTVSYTVEILPFNIRAKGLTLCFVFTSLAGIFNQYVNPVGIEALAWKFYLVYVVILVLECLAIYFLYVETKGPVSDSMLPCCVHDSFTDSNDRLLRRLRSFSTATMQTFTGRTRCLTKKEN